MLGSGQYVLSTGALLLTAINVICINVSGTLAFVLQGVRPRDWWKARQARKATRIALVLSLLLLLALIALIYITKTEVIEEIVR